MGVAQVAPLAIAAVLGGVVGGATVKFLGPSAVPAAASAASARDNVGTSAPAAPASDAARIAALEKEVRTLRGKSAAAQALGAYAKSLAAGNGDGGGAQRSGAMPGMVDAEDPVFDLAVRSVMDAVEWERDEEQRLKRAARRIERAERQTDYLAEQLGLRPDQKEKVKKLLEEQMDAFRALRRPPDGGVRPVTRREWRAAVDKIRGATETKLGEVLDDDQMAKYREIREEDDVGAGRRGRWGGRRGG